VGNTTYFAINQWEICCDHRSLQDEENKKPKAAPDRQIRSPKKAVRSVSNMKRNNQNYATLKSTPPPPKKKRKKKKHMKKLKIQT